MKKWLFYSLFLLFSLAHADQGESSHPNFIKLPAWLTAPEPREMTGVPVGLNMELPPALAQLEQQYPLPSWMLYGVVRSVSTQHIRLPIDLDSQDELLRGVPPKAVHEALQRIMNDCAKASNSEELDARFARYIQCFYDEECILFRMPPTDEAFGRGASQTVELFNAGRTNLPTCGIIETTSYIDATAQGSYSNQTPIQSFRKTELAALQTLLASVRQKNGTNAPPYLEIHGLYTVRRAVQINSTTSSIVTVRAKKSRR